MDRPIPPFYCVYLLRSYSHASLYVGSTPNPRRRLKQHNGLAKGGAVRTARQSSRPWEMTVIVTGFPSKIAALQFEWAWQNTHLTRHIPSEARITSSKKVDHTSRKTGKTRKKVVKPRDSIMDKISNLHILLRVKSFERWPLNVRFLAPSVFKIWEKWCRQSIKRIRPGIDVFMDANTNSTVPAKSTQAELRMESRIEDPAQTPKLSGIEALDVSYVPMKSQLMKATTLLHTTATLNCAICHDLLSIQKDLILICSTESCNMTSHLTCLSGHFKSNEGNMDAVLPVEGQCPHCKKRLSWSDLIRDLTLRTRGQEIIRNILKEPRQKQPKAAVKGEASSIDKENIDARHPELSADSKLAPFVAPGLIGEEDDSDDGSSDDGFVYREDPLDDGAPENAAIVSLDNNLSDSDDSELPKLPKPADSHPLQELSHGRSTNLRLVIADSEENDLEDLLD